MGLPTHIDCILWTRSPSVDAFAITLRAGEPNDLRRIALDHFRPACHQHLLDRLHQPPNARFARFLLYLVDTPLGWFGCARGHTVFRHSVAP